MITQPILTANLFEANNMKEEDINEEGSVKKGIRQVKLCHFLHHDQVYGLSQERRATTVKRVRLG